MDALHYREMKTFLEGGVYPAHLQRDKGGKANFRRLSRRYRVEQRDGRLYKESLPVLKEEELVGEAQRYHGVLGYDHKSGIRRVEHKIRKDFYCVGLREKLKSLCQSRCSVCQLTTAGTVWFAVRVRTFNPVPEEVGRSICDQLGMS